ncbi:23S rRNA (pseudouridine1915-N3)-methyltransferase [Entomoplasma freundtii]|uniref:Ribosomal RNA large subunit methyltransferase H n=1 Tax=Entomoplasma freundtii TaxID=74700 RepID=A0A2K8NRM3_9MOLU|nr:23S rRNA (pseudouridine(1915)-N(3))-methyltransferase RlmH [Entomoplasma freundtii]ATZ16427.1 rRNA large subunit methyltransferase [Entomoplasma freundtii]TDY56534.1 23S rRNA (pseudouridine1915-N3)-methyltransferase [Entomoplasma freundtii]
MKIVILAFGKLDQSFYREAAQEYLKRLSRFADITTIELKEETKYNLAKNQQLNTQLCLDKLKAYSSHEVWFLDLSATCLTSDELANEIGKVQNQTTGKMVFVIGPSDGFNRQLIPSHYNKVAFGRLTLPHQLCRIILLEQIYRSFKILGNENYHK